MSNEAQGLVRNLPMEAPHKPILMAYANYADESGYCFPGVETIAFDTGYSVPTVVRVRRDLIKGNWLRSKRRFGTSAGTRLNLVKIAAEGVVRGDRSKVKPEFEFEDETPGQPQRDQCDLNGGGDETRTDHTDLNEQITLISTTDHTDHLSISPLSVDPSVEAQAPIERQNEQTKEEEAQPPEWALRMVLDWDYGRHRRPTARQANELAWMVVAAHKRGLSRIAIKRHGQATLNAAVRSGVSYLMGGLSEEHLPAIPPPPEPSVAETSGARRRKGANGSREHPYSSEEGRRRAREILADAMAAKKGAGPAAGPSSTRRRILRSAASAGPPPGCPR